MSADRKHAIEGKGGAEKKLREKKSSLRRVQQSASILRLFCAAVTYSLPEDSSEDSCCRVDCNLLQITQICKINKI